MDAFLKRLDNFLEKDFFKKHKEINHGGCCVFAAEIAPHLRKLGKVKIRVETDPYLEDEQTNSITQARKYVGSNTVYDWNDQGVHFWHVAIEFLYKSKTYHIDARGVNGPKHFSFIPGNLTQTEAKELGESPIGWNQSFNRREIPMIRHRIKKFFSPKKRRPRASAG